MTSRMQTTAASTISKRGVSSKRCPNCGRLVPTVRITKVGLDLKPLRILVCVECGKEI